MSEPNTKCYFRYEDGAYCKRWAQHGSRFCFNHQPSESEPGEQGSAQGDPDYRPLRLATPNDVMKLVGDTLNDVRAGRVSVGKAGAMTSLAGLWLKLHEAATREENLRSLQHFRMRGFMGMPGMEAEPPGSDSQDDMPQRSDARQELETLMSQLGGFGPDPEPMP